MKKLIIINQVQFGYNNATYYYCKYLKKDYAIVYIGWDNNLPKIKMNGVKIIYVSRKGNTLFRTMRFLRQSLQEIKDKTTIVFIKYFKGVSLLLRLLKPRNCFVLDIRTGSVNKNIFIRKLYDSRLKFETQFFKHITVISQSLAEKLGIAVKAHILPLGADIISSTTKTFEQFHLLYVGTLSNRNIDVTISGFKQFYGKFGGKVPLTYTIIGSGPKNEERVLRDLVNRYELTDSVNIAGNIPHTQLKAWFDNTNIGVSYVPIIDYYDCQPVTKTFEYLLSGMPVIATNTSENRKVIHPKNGVLVRDTAEDFYSGLKKIFETRYQFDSQQIRNTAMNYAWENIVKENLMVYIEKTVIA